MKTYTNSRRTFLQQSVLAATAMALPSALFAGDSRKSAISFSTLGCPEWTLAEIVKFAVAHNYQGIEIRTIKGELDLSKCPDFSPSNIAASKRLIADNGLVITDLGSSANMHITEKDARKKNLDHGRVYIDLANQLEVPYIRVFPNNLPKDNTRASIIELIIEGLNELGSYAKQSKARVLLESHGDVVKTRNLVYIMEQTQQQEVSLIWDFMNMWTVTAEAPALVYAKLKKYIRHVHVKDGSMADGKVKYSLLGKGNVPVK